MQNKNWRLTGVLIAAILTFSFLSKSTSSLKSIPIQFVKQLDADFSFTENWDYDWGVYKNQYGQLSCDGFCPEAAYAMKKDGRIIEDSLSAFYQLVDTSHLHYTMRSVALMYEFTGCDYIYINRDSNNCINGETGITPGTHSTLNFQMVNGNCEVWANYNSISTQKPRDFPLKSGFIKLEQEAFKADTIKAQFDLTFSNTLESDVALTWKGLIYAPIK
ncbi:MAG: hypothetical protein GQ574_00710 [Crocinitomix sp.]|nr:hypothetical protein [Crocinitomix sp.]